MIGYVTLGTNDLNRAARFYDAVAAELGLGRMMEFDQFIAWGNPGGNPGGNSGEAASGRPGIGVTRPFDGAPASVGNGVMVALEADGPEQVRAIHAAALAHGGRCEGAPGSRGQGFYAGYFRDPDGNKLNAFCIAAVESEAGAGAGN